MECKYCEGSETVKDGKNPSGSEKYYCKTCQRNFTPVPKPNGYEADRRRAAVKMYVDGGNYRRIARTLGVNHQSVVNWVNAAAKQVKPEATPSPRVGEDDVVELDELFTFVGDKKTRSTWLHKSIGIRAVS